MVLMYVVYLLVLLNKQHSHCNILRLSLHRSNPSLPKLSRNEKKYLTFKHLLDPLWQQSLELGRFPEAAGCFQQAVRSQPDRAEYRYALGRALDKLGRRTEALHQFAAAVRLDAAPGGGRIAPERRRGGEGGSLK